MYSENCTSRRYAKRPENTGPENDAILGTCNPGDRRPQTVLTIPEVALELRCSRAHVHNLINGKVRGAKPLPSVRIGRRRLVRRASLDEWIKASEECYDPIIARH
jgi:excisionase family DNA binding protein